MSTPAQKITATLPEFTQGILHFSGDTEALEVHGKKAAIAEG